MLSFVRIQQVNQLATNQLDIKIEYFLVKFALYFEASAKPEQFLLRFHQKINKTKITATTYRKKRTTIRRTFNHDA